MEKIALDDGNENHKQYTMLKDHLKEQVPQRLYLKHTKLT